MSENVMVMPEERNFIKKAKEKMAMLRANYQEKFIDTGKSQELEAKIEAQAERKKKAIKIAGTIATAVLVFVPADGPFGEIATALATPGLCALVDIVTDIKKKLLITGKRGIEKSLLRVDGANENVSAYDLTNGEIVEDMKEALKDFTVVSNGLGSK